MDKYYLYLELPELVQLNCFCTFFNLFCQHSKKSQPLLSIIYFVC